MYQIEKQCITRLLAVGVLNDVCGGLSLAAHSWYTATCQRSLHIPLSLLTVACDSRLFLYFVCVVVSRQIFTYCFPFLIYLTVIVDVKRYRLRLYRVVFLVTLTYSLNSKRRQYFCKHLTDVTTINMSIFRIFYQSYIMHIISNSEAKTSVPGALNKLGE